MSDNWDLKYDNGICHESNLRSNCCMKQFIPGLRNIIDIPFPDRKLPVCKPCKSMFKSRVNCRLQNGHTDVPWNTTYVCVILDDSCSTLNSHGGLCLVSEDYMQFTARLISEPPIQLRAKNDNLGDDKAPICMACKESNYTRHHCREMKKHQELPWVTTYVSLSAAARIPGTDGCVDRNDCGNLNIASKRVVSALSSCSFGRDDDGRPMKKKKIDECYGNGTINTVNPAIMESDDIHKIESSKALLMKIENDRSCKLRWLPCCD